MAACILCGRSKSLRPGHRLCDDCALWQDAESRAYLENSKDWGAICRVRRAEAIGIKTKEQLERFAKCCQKGAAGVGFRGSVTRQDVFLFAVLALVIFGSLPFVSWLIRK